MSLAFFCLNVVLWTCMQLAIARLYVSLPARYFERSTRGSVHSAEVNVYRNYLKIRRWKSLLPDGEGWVGGDFSKRYLQSVSPAYVERFVRETRRGEAVHWTAIFCSPIFFIWNLPATWPVLVLVALLLNGPCIVVQRYNRFALLRWLKRR